MVEQKRAELKKHSHAEIWLDYWGYNVSHNDSDTLYQSPDERKNIQNACSTRCRVESFNLFKTKKTHMESRCRAIFPADLVQLYQKSAPRWKRKRNFCLLPFSFSLAGLLWLVGDGGGGFEWQWLCISIISVSFLAVMGSVFQNTLNY